MRRQAHPLQVCVESDIMEVEPACVFAATQAVCRELKSWHETGSVYESWLIVWWVGGWAEEIESVLGIQVSGLVGQRRPLASRWCRPLCRIQSGGLYLKLEWGPLHTSPAKSSSDMRLVCCAPQL
jgi:hypothetical protein